MQLLAGNPECYIWTSIPHHQSSCWAISHLQQRRAWFNNETGSFIPHKSCSRIVVVRTFTFSSLTGQTWIIAVNAEHVLHHEKKTRADRVCHCCRQHCRHHSGQHEDQLHVFSNVQLIAASGFNPCLLRLFFTCLDMGTPFWTSTIS